MNLDEYISETISILSTHKTDIDEFSLTSDLKEYILNESENLSKVQNLDINNAVDSVVASLGTPEQFADQILRELSQHTKYLILKIIIASLIAFGPFIILILSVLKVI